MKELDGKEKRCGIVLQLTPPEGVIATTFRRIEHEEYLNVKKKIGASFWRSDFFLLSFNCPFE